MANLRVSRVRPRSKAQAFVEFAIIVPLLLIALTGVIEFGYAFYTWAAVGEVARIATRYAVTGEYDTQYCPAAGAALGLATDDLVDGTADCKVPATVANADVETAALQDWARLPSTRDAGMRGGSAGLLFDPAVSGDYVQFLSNPKALTGSMADDGGFKSDYRGTPTSNGFISINVCSNRPGVAFDTRWDHYYNGQIGQDAHYLGVCTITDGGGTQRYSDDAGGPGDRIRVTVTYNHPLIIPFFSALWQHLKISTTQDAIVERFRVSRLAGLSGGISVLSTWTATPVPTDPPTATTTPPPPTSTFTPTITNTSSPTPQPCPALADGTGLRVNYYAFLGDSSNNTWANLVYSGLDPLIDHNWGSGSPNVSVPVDNFRGRWEGQVYPPYPGVYTFQTWSDDGVNLWVNGQQIISDWNDHGDKQDTGTITLSCTPVAIQMDYYENSGGADIKLGWSNGNITTQLPIQTKWLYPLSIVPIPTSTYLTPTPTKTYTRTATRTASNTYTPKPPTNTFTPSNTFTATVPSNTPTKTVVQPATNTPQPPTATTTPSPTNTRTPVPTCPFSKDAGGCTPVP